MSGDVHVRFCESLGVKFPRATRLVICCRGTAGEAMTAMRSMMAALKLTINERKTHVREVPAERFDFLGYTFGLHWTHRTKRKLLCGAPSRKRVTRVCRRISVITNRKRSGLAPAELVTELNRVLRGWAGYFCLGPVSDAYRAVNAHVRYRYRKWWDAKHKNARFGPFWYWSPWLEQTFGLLQLRWDPARLPQRRVSTRLPHAKA